MGLLRGAGTDHGSGAASSRPLRQALGVRERSDQPIVAALQRTLRDRQLLVLLDNVEQVLGTAVQLAASCRPLLC